MSPAPSHSDDRSPDHQPRSSTRHSHEDALTDRAFEQLLTACEQLPDPVRFEARLICLLAGRLGLRAGEITHLRTAWIDWDRTLIRIPQHEPCACGYCRRQARRASQHDPDQEYEQALADRWHPKTPTAARVVPFDVSLRVELCLEAFADQYEAFPHSRSMVNRRLDQAAEVADLQTRVYPHCLRATAASYHAYRGVPPVPLQALMGWTDLSTAQKYIRISGTATARAVRRAHNR